MPLIRDASAFLSVVEAHKGIIYKVANSYCRDAEDRKDLIQEIVLQLWLSFPKYDEQYRLSTWIYRIALNVSISFYRKTHSRGKLFAGLSDELLYLPAAMPAESMDAQLAQLQRFIRELKEIDRAVVLLYLEETSQQEIAEVLGLSLSNVSTKISRIKQQLKQKFAGLPAS